MVAIIKQEGKNPEEDSTIKQWKNELKQYESGLARLEESFSRAFIQFQKFKLASTEDEREALDQLLETGLAQAMDFTETYKDLKKKIEGQSDGQ